MPAPFLEPLEPGVSPAVSAWIKGLKEVALHLDKWAFGLPEEPFWRRPKEGANAIGLSGLDGRLFVGRRKTAVKYVENGKVKVHRGDYTGTVEEVNKALLDLLLQAGYLPVLTPPALSYENEAINTDGDQIAALLATLYGAEALVYLSNVPGLLARYPDEASLVREIPVERIEDPEYLALAQGRMKRKVMGAVEAVKGGVKRVVFADGRVENPIRRALSGEGTVVR